MDQNECMNYCWVRDMTYSDLVAVCAANKVPAPSFYTYAQYGLVQYETMAIAFGNDEPKEKPNAVIAWIQKGLRAGKGYIRRARGKAQARRAQSSTDHHDEGWDG